MAKIKGTKNPEIAAINARTAGLRHYVDEYPENETLYKAVKAKLLCLSESEIMADAQCLALYETIKGFADAPLPVGLFKGIVTDLDREFPRYRDVMKISLDALKENYSPRAAARAYMQAYHSGDPVAIDWAMAAMIHLMSGYIGMIIKRYNAGVSDEFYKDLFQVGAEGCLMNMARYDPEWTQPTTYFTPHIVHNVARYMMEERMPLATGHMANIAVRVQRALSELEKQGLEPTISAITNMVNRDGKKDVVTYGKVQKALQFLQQADLKYIDESADQKQADREDLQSSFLSVQESAIDKLPEKAILRQELCDTIRHALAELPEPHMEEIILGNVGFTYGEDGLIELSHKQSFTELASKLTKDTGETFTTHRVSALFTKGVKHLRSNRAFRSYLPNERYGRDDNLLFSLKPNPEAENIGAELEDLEGNDIPAFVKKREADVIFTF